MAPLRRVLQLGDWTWTPPPHSLLLQSTTLHPHSSCSRSRRTIPGVASKSSVTLHGQDGGRAGPPNGSRQDNRQLPTPAIRPQEISEVGENRIRVERLGSCASGVSNVWGEESLDIRKQLNTLLLCLSSPNAAGLFRISHRNFQDHNFWDSAALHTFSTYKLYFT